MFDRGQKVEVAESDNGDGSTQVTIPIEADFLYVYSTADGLYGIACVYRLQTKFVFLIWFYVDDVSCRYFGLRHNFVSI